VSIALLLLPAFCVDKNFFPLFYIAARVSGFSQASYTHPLSLSLSLSISLSIFVWCLRGLF